MFGQQLSEDGHDSMKQACSGGFHSAKVLRFRTLCNNLGFYRLFQFFPCLAQPRINLLYPRLTSVNNKKIVNLMQFRQFYVGDATVGGEIVV